MVFHSQVSLLRYFDVKVRVDRALLRKGLPASHAADMAHAQGNAAVQRVRSFRAQHEGSEVTKKASK